MVMINVNTASGVIILRVEMPADFSATISYRSPIFPKVISEASITANGKAMEERETAA